MNVSKKILVIIYIIFALLISGVIFASQGILNSSYSNLEDREASISAKYVQNIIDFQTTQLDETNYVLSSREDIRAFMLSPENKYLSKTTFTDLISLNGYDFIFLANSSGNVIYSQFSGSNNTSNTSISSAINRKFVDKSFLHKDAESLLKGVILIENDPFIISCRPVFASSDSKVIIGTIVLGKNLDADFMKSVHKITRGSILAYSPNNMHSDFQQAFLGSEPKSPMPSVEKSKENHYFILEDINKNPALTVWIDNDMDISTEGHNSIRYIVLFLLFIGLVIGAGCKLLLDREVISRIVAIDAYVEKVGKNEDFPTRHHMEGNDELSRLTDGINQMLDRLKISSDKFKAQENEKKIILNALNELVVFVDPDLKIIWANKAFLEYIGSKLEDLAGHEYENLLMMHVEDSCKSFLKKALESGTEELGEINTPDGRTWMICATIIWGEDGKIYGVLQTGLDITAYKRSEEKLLQAKLEAEAANRTKSEFLANMSHELRTPLNSIIGFSDVLLERIFGELNEKQLKYVNNISTSGKHLLGLINEILDLSKVEAGKMELHYSEFSISSVFEEVRVAFTPFAQQKYIEITFDMKSVSTLEADRNRLIQVLNNLVNNAIKFTPDGGKIFVHYKEIEGRALISVVDTGIGISPEEQKKIFQPFTQIDSSSSRQYCGTGLGLSLVKKIVNLHQGDIWVESDIGKGSTFTLVIPFRKPAEPRKNIETAACINP
jgi:PAS domain S-box-containing protein